MDNQRVKKLKRNSTNEKKIRHHNCFSMRQETPGKREKQSKQTKHYRNTNRGNWLVRMEKRWIDEPGLPFNYLPAIVLLREKFAQLDEPLVKKRRSFRLSIARSEPGNQGRVWVLLLHKKWRLLSTPRGYQDARPIIRREGILERFCKIRISS